MVTIPDRHVDTSTLDASIDVQEPSNILGPLIQLLDSRNLSAKIDLYDFESFLSTYEAALKYRLDKILEQIRIDLKYVPIVYQRHPSFIEYRIGPKQLVIRLTEKKLRGLPSSITIKT